MSVDQLAIAQQVLQRVGEALDLKDVGAGDRAGGADDGIARADQDFGPAVDRARAVLELPGEAVVHAAKARLLRLAQIQVREEAPHPDRQVAHHRLLDPAEPAHELGGQPARDPVGEQEIDVLLLDQPQDLRSKRHGIVKSVM